MSLNDLFAEERKRRGLDNPAPPPPSSGNLALVNGDDPRAQRWVEAKVAAQLDEVRGAAEGTRNDTLNRVAYSLGRRVPAYLDEQHITAQLILAAHECGLDPVEARQTVRSGLTKGMSDPLPVTLSDSPTGGLADLVAGPVTVATPRASTADADQSTFDSEAEDAALRLLMRERVQPLDWHELWADDSEEEWIVEPILPARRLVALYSAPKVGKSLLMLELAAAVARGVPVLGMTPDRARRVLYIDFENDPKADIRERLQAMGVGPGDLDGLRYFSFPTLANLDSDRGGKELMALVAEHACEVVVVDTVSRSIAGEENENDTWLAFYRHTGLRLKQAGVALIRLDHSGKDETKGQRGGSAKSGDVDAVWRLSRVTEDTYRLDCEAARMPVTERVLVLHRKQGPLRHTVDAEGRKAAWDVQVRELVEALERHDVPKDFGRDKARQVLKEHGVKARNAPLSAALKRRSEPVPDWRGQVVGEDLSP